MSGSSNTGGRGLSDLYARVSSGAAQYNTSNDHSQDPNRNQEHRGQDSSRSQVSLRHRDYADRDDRHSSSSRDRDRDRDHHRQYRTDHESVSGRSKRRRSLSPEEGYQGASFASGSAEAAAKVGRYDRHRDRFDRADDNANDAVADIARREGNQEEEEEEEERRYRHERRRERDYGREGGRQRAYDRDGERREPHRERGERERGDERSRQDYHERSRDRDYQRHRSDRDYRDDRNSRGYRFDDSRGHDRYDQRHRKSSSSSSSSVQILFDRFARLSPWNGPAVCPLEERTRHLRNWDAPPPGFERVSADKAKAIGLFPPPGNVTKIANYLPPTLDPARMAMLQLLTGSSGNAATGRPEEVSNSSNNPSLATANPAIVKQARRFYVGNLPNPVHESQLGDFLERNLSGLAAAGPDAPRRILSVNVSSDRTYAFVEVKTAEDATMAMNLDGVLFQGVQLKIRRPKEYHLAVTAQQQQQQQQHNQDDSNNNNNNNTPNNTGNYYRGSNAAVMELLPRPLILSDIPDFLTEQHLRALLGLVAELRQFVLLKSQGVAVFEFVEDERGEEWSGPLLKHTQGSIFVGPFEMKLERLLSVYSSSSTNDDSSSDSNQEEVANRRARLRNVLSCFNLQPGYATAPHSTPILQLLNLVTRESLQAAGDDIQADLLAELKTFTSDPDRLELILPRPNGDELVPGVGRVFVKFPGGVEEAAKAASVLAGRIFDGRTCIVSFYPEDKYEKRQF